MKRVPLKRSSSLTRKKPVQRRIGAKKRVSRSKLVSVSKLKRELDRVFSLYIRAKYGKTCYTCGGQGTLQCGHFISRSYLATRWDESNARPQCVGCNIWGHGKFLDFEEHLVKELGANRVQELKDARKQLIKPTRKFYTEQILLYQEKVKELQQE